MTDLRALMHAEIFRKRRKWDLESEAAADPYFKRGTVRRSSPRFRARALHEIE